MKRWAALALVLLLPAVHIVPVPAAPLPPLRRVNAPYFPGGVEYEQTAVFWLGRVTPNENYADVRAGYDNIMLYLNLAAFDRRLWYDADPSPASLTAWDAASLYLKLDGNAGTVLTPNTFRFDGQLTWWESPRMQWQAAYRGNGSGWAAVSVPFTTTAGWRGDAPNNDVDDRGWGISFEIPFASLGLSGPPSQGTVWGLGVVLHDRDDAAGTPIPDKTWPQAMDPNHPATWEQMSFGLPRYTPPSSVPGGTITIRHKLNGITVEDGAVGGGTTCGSGLDFWTRWGDKNYAGIGYVNVQNQGDVSDWPCFSKYYVTFPLDQLSSGKVIISATLTLHQFGNAGQGWTPGPQPSFIQVLTVGDGWNESTLTWNNAPLARENLGGIWVDPLDTYPGYPGVPRLWDIGRAAAEAYAAGTPLRLVLYSADWAYHSGRYFYSSDTEDLNAVGRPTLAVTWGEPLATIRKVAWPLNPSTDQQVTYTLHLVGNGLPLTLTDYLPSLVSSPERLELRGSGIITYDADAHRIDWSGTATVGQAITITFPVTVLSPSPAVVLNTAVLTDALGRVSSNSAMLIANGFQTWLPLVIVR